MIETIYIIHGEHTRYRIQSNPDCDAVDGSQGVVIEWQDTDTSQHSTWYGSVFIGPDQFEELGDVFHLLAKNIKDKK